MYKLGEVVISVGFPRSYSEIGAWEGGHTLTREAPAAQNAEDSTAIRQLATSEMNWWARIVDPAQTECNFHPKLLCRPRIGQDAQARPGLPRGCRWKTCSISGGKPVLDLPTVFSPRGTGARCWYVVCWSTSGLRPLDEVWMKPGNPQGS